MNQEIIENSSASLVELVAKADTDIQIATAKRYPRSIRQFMDTARELVTLNEQVAADCMYAVPRDGHTIEGASARFAEIILSAWGNSRAGARVVHEDDKFITAQGVCHDLQNNTVITMEVRRRITNRQGKKFSDDMVVTTGNAACSIALRNSIVRVVPKALWEPLYQEARKVAIGDASTLANRRAVALSHLLKFGATESMVLELLGVKGVEDITLDHLATLRGVATAIKDGETVDNIFGKKEPEKHQLNVVNDINAEIAAKAAQPTPPHDPETGEIIEANAEAAESTLEGLPHTQSTTIDDLKAMRHATEEEANAKAASILALLESGTPKLELLKSLGASYEVTLAKATNQEIVAKIKSF